MGASVTAISAGADHVCGIKTGAARCWGAGASGQLGNNATANKLISVAVTGLTSGVTSITAGAAHSCAVVSAAAKCWGAGSSGQLGNGASVGSLVAVAVSGLSSGVSSVAAGSSLTVALSTGGAIQAFGDNSAGVITDKPGNKWTRYITAIDGDMAATYTSTGQYTYTISNVRGDVVAMAGESGLTQTAPVDEFGNPVQGLAGDRRYGFHGSKQREALTGSGIVAMGVRLYTPASGRFLQVDPVLGGTANAYEYPSDPVNMADLDGRRCTSVASCALSNLYNRFAPKRNFVYRWFAETVCVVWGWTPAGRNSFGKRIMKYGCRAWSTVRYMKKYYI